MWTIVSIRPNAANFTMGITYDDGEVILADFRPLMNKSEVMTALRDSVMFGTARIGARGRSIVWEGKAEFCADALRLKFGHQTGQGNNR